VAPQPVDEGVPKIATTAKVRNLLSGVSPLYLTAILPQSTFKSSTFSGTAPTSNST
jgi:hypothetical protein